MLIMHYVYGSIEKQSEAEEELKEAFKLFDKDQDGYISPTEVQLTSYASISINLFDHKR